MSHRCEAQIRLDWDFLPGVRSLAFATKVNTGMTMSIARALRRSTDQEIGRSAQDIGASAARIYKLLWEGEFVNHNGTRQKVNGDISKIAQIEGLDAMDKALLQNYHFISTRISGTRQIRRNIRHLVFSSRIFYGVPVFMTFTPSERHSGLAIRLYRGRGNDPAYSDLSEQQRLCLSYQYPTLCPAKQEDDETCVVDLPVRRPQNDYSKRSSLLRIRVQCNEPSCLACTPRLQDVSQLPTLRIV